jgi:hypothetical protein
MVEVDTNASKKLQNYWDNFSAIYQKEAAGATIQQAITCIVQAQVPRAKRVLEQACGTGMAASLMISHFM